MWLVAAWWRGLILSKYIGGSLGQMLARYSIFPWRGVLVEMSLGTGWTGSKKSILNKKSIKALERREEGAFCLEPKMQMRPEARLGRLQRSFGWRVMWLCFWKLTLVGVKMWLECREAGEWHSWKGREQPRPLKREDSPGPWHEEKWTHSESSLALAPWVMFPVAMTWSAK